jgi:MOSC domain-containing protein YiiM
MSLIKAYPRVTAVCISERKGERKRPVDSVELRENHGIVGDAHAGDWHRQVSLLAAESIDRMRAAGADVSAGDFAENITTEGIDLASLPLGTRLQVGEAVLLEVTQIGKECHTRCSIFQAVGDCVMPREGIFARVLTGGVIKAGDLIERIV